MSWLMENRWANMAVFAGRVLIALLFLGGAMQKATNPDPVIVLLEGWQLPGMLVWPALAFNAVAGLCLVLGVLVRPMALGLAGYCALTSLFHFLPDDPWQMTIFVKNWAIAGGCLILAAHGAGRWALQPHR